MPGPTRGRADGATAARRGHPRAGGFQQARADQEKHYPVVRPEEFYDSMDSLIEQDALRLKLASDFYQYTLYLQNPSAGRPNLLVFGRSGSGKTYGVELCCKASDLPVTIASVAGISPPGFRGRVLLDIMIDHWRRWKTDKGVIFLDEIDKTCAGSFRAASGGRSSHEVSELERGGIAMQYDLLKFMEAQKVSFTDDAKDFPELEGVVFDTGNTFWIFAGAFTNLDRYIRKRLSNNFISERDIWEHAIPQDFKLYGMTQEFADRIGTWAWTRPLLGHHMVQILKDQDLPRWRQRFDYLGVKLDLRDGALGACAQHAWEQKEGPRVARAMLNRGMDDILILASQHRKQDPEWKKPVIVEAENVRSGQIAFN